MDAALLSLLSTGTPAAIFAAVFLLILNKYITATEKRETWFQQTIKEFQDNQDRSIVEQGRLVTLLASIDGRVADLMRRNENQTPRRTSGGGGGGSE